MGKSGQRRSVPDFIRRGLRQGLGTGALVAIGYEVVEPLGDRGKTASQWLTCFKWAAISLIVLTAPVLGKVAQVSFERTLGTVAGGLLGLTTVLVGREMMQASDQAFTAVISGLVCFGSVWLGHRLKMDYAGKLLAMTFILVVIGADGRVDAFLVAITRCSGILLGVFLSVVLAVVVFPKSASHQAADNLADALEGLCLLNQIAWNAGLPAPGVPEASPRGSGEVYVPLAEEDSGARLPASSADREAECEKVLMEVYNKLSKVDEFLPLAKRERYLMTFRGRWCFLPALPYLGLGDWRLPEQPLRELATAIRRVARVLWALHVTFQEGFEEELPPGLRERFPDGLLPQLQASAHAALTDMRGAFPDDTILPNTNLSHFLQVAEELFRVSEEQRRRMLRALGPIAGTSGLLDPLTVLASPGPKAGTGGPLRLQATAVPGRVVLEPAQSGGDAVSFAEPESSLGRESADGDALNSSAYISKIRWFSFQFILQQLAQELRAMHRSMAVVLKMLPNALEARHI